MSTLCGVRGVGRSDAAIAAGFVLAAAAEAVALHRSTPGLLAFGTCGALVLAVLGVRRTRPVVTLCVLAVFGVIGTVVQAEVWPDAEDSGGVWIFALMLACYSLGAHGPRRVLVLGGLLPLLIVAAVDLPTMQGWALVNGVVFVTAFVGVLPTVVGRVVRVRRDRLISLAGQRERIVQEQRAASESAALAERLRATERLRPALLDGLRGLARSADDGTDPARIEAAARDLLTRTRVEVVALAAPIATVEPADPAQVDHVRALRAAAQRWSVLGAGAIAAGVVLESAGTLDLAAPGWAVLVSGAAIGGPLALVWWRPLPAVATAWCAAAVFSHLVAPLGGTLSGAALTLSTAFVVAALSSRPTALAGLATCWLGQRLVGTDDPIGDAAIVLACWVGGMVLSEVSELVEQERANNRLLADQEGVAAQRAVVEERLRLAREIHDHIGHSLTVAALQAGAARRLGAADPERARAALRTVAAAAREGLVVLDPNTSADLEGLLELTRTAGLAVDAELADLAGLGPGARGVVHRLVQEALTNVLRHAPGARVGVVVRLERDGVVVAVSNTAPSDPGSGPGTGRGLDGIRERVASLAGEVRWGPRPDGGFEVRAMLPAVTREGVTP